jgi:hypothetical protein
MNPFPRTTEDAQYSLPFRRALIHGRVGAEHLQTLVRALLG